MADAGSSLTLRQIDHVQDLLDRLRLDRTARTQGAIIVEGPHDSTLLSRALSPGLNFFPASGRVNVLKAADRLEQTYLSGVLCVVDMDFDEEAANRVNQWFLIFSDNADVEAMLYWSPALARVLEEWASQTKLANFGGADAVRTVVEAAVRPLATLRAWNARHQAGLRFDTLDLADLVPKQTLSINPTQLVLRLARPPDVAAERLIDALGLDPPSCSYTRRLLAQGGDRLAVVGASLRHVIGSLSKQQVAGRLVEGSLRLAVRPSDLTGTPFLARFNAALARAFTPEVA
jgi:hypothetical protein